MSKKNCYWIIGILLFIIVLLLTKHYGADEETVSYIGFAGTLISIILAVIAIIYSFYQSSVYDNSTRSLNESSIRIKKLVKDVSISFNKLSSSIENINELKLITKSLENSIKVIEEVSCDIQGGVNETKEEIKYIKNKFTLFDNTEKNTINSNQIIYSEDQIKNIMSSFVFVHRIVLCALYKAYIHKKEFNLRALVEHYICEADLKTSEEFQESFYVSFLTVVQTFKTFNILNIGITQLGSINDVNISVSEHTNNNIIGKYLNSNYMDEFNISLEGIDKFIEKQ